MRVGGYRFFFYSMEGREPPHIHVAHAGRYAIARDDGDSQSYSRETGMSTLVEKVETLAVDVSCSRDALSVTLSDGRVVSVPLVWFPRLADASSRERSD